MTSRFKVHQALYYLKIATILSVSLILGACGGGQGAGSGPKALPFGNLSLSVTDAPMDGATALVLHFTQVTTVWSGPAGNVLDDYDVIDPGTGQPGYDVDLLDLTGNKSLALLDESILASNYPFILLRIDYDLSHIDFEDGSSYKLACTSTRICDTQGRIVLTDGFTVEGNKTLGLVLDFDLRQSVFEPTDTSGNAPYSLEPVVHVVNADDAGQIIGDVSPGLMVDTDGNLEFDDCYIYVFEGGDALPDDIMQPASGAHVNPLTTVPVSKNANGAGNYPYSIDFLPSGTYTLALTCDGKLDDPRLDDNTISFPATLNNIGLLPGRTLNRRF